MLARTLVRLTPRRSLSLYAHTQCQKNSDLDASLLSVLKERGLVSNVTSEDLDSAISKENLTVYCGADPTAKSLHVGNMMPLMILLHFYIRGHNLLPLVGGATGQVGDPSGRTTERTRIVDDEREDNVVRIQSQMGQFFERASEYAFTRGYVGKRGDLKPLNNAEWWKGVSFLGFLGTYGRHIRVGHMLARESVKARLNSEQGIGFNEFAYQVLQAYDFWHLFKTYNCRIQVGGNDQWGNITAGIDLISRLRSHLDKKDPKHNQEAYGITVPLLTTPSGEKFGKSAGNAVWLDNALTKPYDLYQYFIKAPDSVVESYLKLFTLIPLEEIPQIMEKHRHDESLRYAQRVLASEVTDLIHGTGAGHRSQLISAILFPIPGDQHVADSSASEILNAFEAEGLVKEIPKSELLGQPWKSVLATTLGKSKSEAGRLLKGGGVYVGLKRANIRSDETFQSSHLVDDSLLLIRVGKGNYTVVRAI
jgi:tyrosyl-tRNA synthetase